MKIRLASSLLFLLTLILASPVAAETRYISDHLIVTVRDNTSRNHQVLETLETGTAVEVLGVEGNFFHVRTEKGTEGYISAQYVTKQIPKATQIANLKKQLSSLQNELASYQQDSSTTSNQIANAKRQIASLNEELAQKEQELEKLTNDYNSLFERSETALELADTHDLLTEENNRLSSELAVLQEENKSFHRSNMIQWFLAGGGVFLVGWLAGKVSRKKRNYSRF